MAVPIISFPQSAFPFKTSTSAKSAAAGLRSSRDATVLKIADTFDTLTASVNIIENLIRSCRIVDEAWFKVIGIGGTGYENAPFLVDRVGVVSLRTPDQVSVGWLGSKFDTAKVVTGAVDNGAGLIRLTVAAHGYVSGNTLKVRDVGGVPNATGYWVITRISATQFDLVGSTFAGTYTTGGTAQRYYGGAWFQTLFVGGTSAADAKFVADAAGNLTITNALISLTSGTKSIVLDPTNASITIADTLTDLEGIFTAGTLTFRKVSVAEPTMSLGYVPGVTGALGLSATKLSGATSYLSMYIDTTNGNTLRRYEAQVGDVTQVYDNGSASVQVFYDRFRGTTETPIVASSADRLGDIYWRAAQGLLITPRIAAQISATVKIVAAGGVTGTLNFLTNTVGSVPTERLTIDGAFVGINNSLPETTLDIAGTTRITDVSTPAAGFGLEMFYATRSQIRAYNRTTSTWLPLWIDAEHLVINSQDASARVLIQTATVNADGGMLQVNGDITPDVDQGGDLGTANVQWDDIRFKGDLKQGTVVRISSTGVATLKYSLTSYANNAAALAGGLTAGDLYTETGTDPLRVCVVV